MVSKVFTRKCFINVSLSECRGMSDVFIDSLEKANLKLRKNGFHVDLLGMDFFGTPGCDCTIVGGDSENVKVLVKVRVKQDLREFEIREGDGNVGCYRRGTVMAIDAFDALRLASRQGLIRKPWDVKLSQADGDDISASLASFVKPIYGDACRWIASAEIVEK